VKAITVLPGPPASVQLDERPEPDPDRKTPLVEAVAKADRRWLSRLITRKVPLSRWQEAFQGRPEDIKVVLQLAEAA
jgi:hypothetical protein